MKVRTRLRFKDLQEDVEREVGDVFEVTEARYEVLAHTSFGALVEVVERPVVEVEEQSVVEVRPANNEGAEKKVVRKRKKPEAQEGSVG